MPAEIQARLLTGAVDVLLDLGRRVVRRIGQAPASTHAGLLVQLRGIAIADTDAAIESGRERRRSEEDDQA
jgi:hypothetical protein